MATTRVRFERAEKHVKLLEESWLAKLDTSGRRRSFEEYAEAVMVFELLNHVAQQRREHVYRGLEDADPEIDAAEKDLYGRWLATVEDKLHTPESLEPSVASAEVADKFRACVGIAGSFLEKWTPAVLAMAPGSRVVDFSEEDTDEIRAIINAPPGSPGRLTKPTRSVPMGDPALLFRVRPTA
jgi:hypothetical protein